MLWSSSRTGHAALVLAAMVLLAMGAKPLSAATTDISSEPLITRTNVSAKPNMMFILDDSGSMAWSYMPDEINGNTNVYALYSAQCNGLAYDPTVTYSPPITSTNTNYANASFTAAKTDGYVSTSGTVDLTNTFYYRYATTGTLQPKMGWTYDSSGNVITSTTFYQECMSTIGASPGSSKFTKVTMTASSTDAQNYANWYSYYSKRYLLMRTAVGKAVQALDSGYRVGFSRINSTSITDGANFRDVKVFDATQKANFYSSLYGAAPAGGTPLRGALAKVGQYYAKKVSGQTYDPMEYACQRNFAILTTDGYWNSGGSPGVAESSTYGPYKLDGTLVGNQDATELRPMYDGGSSTTVTKTPTTTVTVTKTDSFTKTTRVTTRNKVEVTTSGCTFGRKRTLTTRQTLTESFTTQATTYSQDTVVATRTVTVTNGSVTGTSDATTTTTTTPSSPVAPAPIVTNTTTNPNYEDGSTIVTQNCTFTLAASGVTTTTPSTTSTTDNVTDPNISQISKIGPTTGTPEVTTTTSGGSSDTLSDVAQYYYSTDLRNAALGNCASTTAAGVATDVCSDIVPGGGRDTNTAQHLTTFTIGLGVSGTLAYDKNYLTQTSGDYVALKNGTKNWPATTTIISGGSGDARNIDDLWHAAVNGRGQYYSALDATALSAAISGVVNSIAGSTGSGAAASFDTLVLVPDDAGGNDANRVFQAGYKTNEWTGDVKSYSVDGATGEISDTVVWSAQTMLAAKTWSDRKIYYRQGPTTPTLRLFNFTNLDADGYTASNFLNFCSKTVVAAQCSTLVAANVTLANSATNLINYLRGDATYEETNTTSPLFRSRNTLEGRKVLGDIIAGAPVYVGKPPFAYTDAGYASYAASKASRKPMVYAGANDGMLHAFSAATGEELWAYVPTAVMPNMYKLANANYASLHQYFVDAEPVVGDVYVSGAWRTILVGGLGAGGRAYFALDVTDPDNPQTLWEFTDTNLGLSYGNPIITKRADGTWVVAFASGYNNTNDGKGRLFVLNAYTGAKLLDLPTTAGSSATPSGLAKINAWVDKATNNTTTRFYGGDLLGNLWRFDIDNLYPPNQAAHLMAQLQTSSGAPQPITARPEPVLINGLYAAVAVGTGRFLGTSDVNDTTQQSLYLLKDKLTSTGLGVVRTNTNVVKHTVSVTDRTANTVTPTNSVNWDTQDGWWFDLPVSAERIVTNMGLLGSTLAVATAVPSGDACKSGGSSWLYQIDINTGLKPKSEQAIGKLYSDKALIVGLTGATTSGANGDPGTSTLYVKDSEGKTEQISLSPVLPAGSGPTRRSSWRELID